MAAENSKGGIPLIQVDHMKKYYPIKGGIITHITGQVKAVDDVSFSIVEGETLGLVGESGCGKSTIGRALVGLESPTAGSVFYRGRELDDVENARNPPRIRRSRRARKAGEARLSELLALFSLQSPSPCEKSGHFDFWVTP